MSVAFYLAGWVFYAISALGYRGTSDPATQLSRVQLIGCACFFMLVAIYAKIPPRKDDP